MSLVSVIVPVYNGEPYIKRCLDSLLTQTYPHFEVIVVDDGSTDRTMEILQAYREQFKGVFIPIQLPNGGQGTARNQAIQLATGEYLAFVDSDDFVEPTYLETLVQAIESESADLAICAYHRVSESGEILMTEMQKNQGNRQAINTSVWNKLFKRSLWVSHQVEFAEGLWYEDIEAVLSYLAVTDTIAWISTPIYHYVQRAQSSIQLFDERVENIFQVADRVFAYAKREGISGERLIELEGHMLTHVILGHLSRCAMEPSFKMRSQYIERTKQYVESRFPRYLKHPAFQLKGVLREKTTMSFIRYVGIRLLALNLFGLLLGAYRLKLKLNPAVKRW